MPEEKRSVQKTASKPQGAPKLVLRFWKPSELWLFGPLLVLGISFSLVQLLTWGLPSLREARRFTPARCTVVDRYIHSRIEDGRTGFRPEIKIRYKDRAGKEFVVNAYDKTTLDEGGGFDYTDEEAYKILTKYTPGEQRICRYLTEEPSKAILRRDAEIWQWLFLTIHVSLALSGVVGLVWIAKRRSSSLEWSAESKVKPDRTSTIPGVQRIKESPGIDLPYRLPTFVTPVAQNLVGLALTALWNVVAFGTFVYVLLRREDLLDLILGILFGVIFCGLGLVGFFAFSRRTLRILRTGSTIIEASNYEVVPNRRCRLSLRQSGPLTARFYSVALCCEEMTRYTKGTDVLTNKQEVLRFPLFERTDFHVPSGETFREEFFMKVPSGAMHSFISDSNEIRWKISVQIKTGRMGTIVREAPIVVVPDTAK